jgi:hypothetical protein
MHDSVRSDLLHQLQQLSSDERSELMDEAAGANKADEGMQAAADALAHHIHPTRKD